MAKSYCLVFLLAYGCSLERGGAATFQAADGGHQGSAPGDGSPSEPGDGAAMDAGDPPATGDGTTGDGATGDGATGDGATGDGATGDGTTGDGTDNPPADAGLPPEDAGTTPVDAGTEPGGFTPSPGQVGAPCTENNQCTGINNRCLETIEVDGDEITLPGGYCTHGCLAVCGANEKCVSNVCARACGADSDCRAPEGYRCVDDICVIPTN